MALLNLNVALHFCAVCIFQILKNVNTHFMCSNRALGSVILRNVIFQQ